MAGKIFPVLTFVSLLLISTVHTQTAITIATNAVSGLTRFMAAGSIMATITVAGGNGVYTFQDPNPQFSILRNNVLPSQASVINRQPVGPGSYVLPITVRDSAGLTLTSSITITVT
ncbi:hypothetical protein BV898_01982 [Hypsibius exemplaris]|uniref:Cadherin domain-containing protein n=1 Tax=Hypsibius exemplaris TaxID=2072580 RepID=A0A1W0X904_HYPEX|nr:hypothetical protein BV898_01982 [Hypsibius exemplaris]